MLHLISPHRVSTAELQIRRDNRYNVEIFLHQSMPCDPSLEPSHRDGSIAGHNVCFHREIRKNISKLSSLFLVIWSVVGWLVVFGLTAL